MLVSEFSARAGGFAKIQFACEAIFCRKYASKGETIDLNPVLWLGSGFLG